MQFTNPATKEEMYNILQEIFYYYRIRRESWKELELKPLKLNKLEFIASTEEKLLTKAEELVKPEINLKKYESIQKIQLAKAQLYGEIVTLNQQLQQRESEIIALYDKQVEECKNELSRLGTSSSTIALDRINDIRDKQNQEITKVRQDLNERISILDSEISSLENKITEADSFFTSLLQEEIQKKVIELREQESELQAEVVKYNNQIDEKELKHSNKILTDQANLELKYRELNQEFFSKDQLIEMGYYEDVLRCVCAYYDTLPALIAYQSFIEDTKVIVYLEDYYSDVIYSYKAKAGQL